MNFVSVDMKQGVLDLFKWFVLFDLFVVEKFEAAV